MKTSKFFLIIFLTFILIKFCNGNDINDPHNVSIDDWGLTGNACKTCHPLSNSLSEINLKPLWNSIYTGKTYTIYSSSTLNANVEQPDGNSKLCLSCHDGTLTSHDIGNDLSNDHPVSFVYNSTLAIIDGNLYDPSTTLSGLGSTIEHDLLDAGKMQCTSCHNPHMSGQPKLLIAENGKSELCFKCHNI